MAVHNVVPFHEVPQVISLPSDVRQIPQEALIRIIQLRNAVAAFKQHLEAAESEVRSALESGAAVEPGVHVASLKESLRRAVAWREVAERLADRLYNGKGAGYCENVLQNTHPSKTVSLVVS